MTNPLTNGDLTFHEGAGTDDGTLVGDSPTSKVGFYGATPVVQQVVPLTSPTLAQVITALVNAGIVAQHD